MRKHKHPYRIRKFFVRMNPKRLFRAYRDHYPQTLRELFENSTERYSRRTLSQYVEGDCIIFSYHIIEKVGIIVRIEVLIVFTFNIPFYSINS